MTRYKEVKEKIQNKFEELPKNQRKLARYILDNFDKVPFLNVQDISLANGASVASVVRFAQRIGFSGYSELREAISDSLQHQLTYLRNIPLFDKKKTEKDILTSVANLDMKNINDTLALIEWEVFDTSVDMIFKSRRVFTAGLGISYLLSEILAYQLSQVAVEASAFKNNACPFYEQIAMLDKRDLLIVFSFPPYSKDTVELAKIASEKRINVIAITNKEVSPSTFFSTLNLIVHSENMLFTNSFAAISVLINALATALALKNQAKTKTLQKETSEILEKYNKTINY
ncbi:MAG: MurR/RpiR family transcriptional regulator [Ignavibacteriales bacterium]|nr:MurR/RpiR family transcriptional regulator [Ignavibacteriales bacterium]